MVRVWRPTWEKQKLDHLRCELPKEMTVWCSQFSGAVSSHSLNKDLLELDSPPLCRETFTGIGLKTVQMLCATFFKWLAWVPVMFNGHRRESGNKVKQLEGGRTFICGTQLTRRFSDISVCISRTHSWNVTTLISTAQLSSLNQELCRLAGLCANCGKFPEVWGQCGKGFKIKLCYML